MCTEDCVRITEIKCQPKERREGRVEWSRARRSPSIATLAGVSFSFSRATLQGGEKDAIHRERGGARINATCVANLKPPSPWSLFRQPVPAPPLWDFNNAARYGWSDDDRVKMQHAKYRCREPRRTGVPSKMGTRD